jgi:hypothetical protein
MDYASPSASPAAPNRCGDRPRRIARVKFVALVIDEPPRRPAAESLSTSPARLYLRVRAFLFRAIGRLVAARP